MHRPAPQRISSVPETPTTTALAAPGTLAFGALLIANVALAFGPWFVRATEVGPVAAGFWRLTLAVPFLVLLAAQQGARPTRLGRGVWVGLIAGGVCFAADARGGGCGAAARTILSARCKESRG
jgi:hypothetical protein